MSGIALGTAPGSTMVIERKAFDSKGYVRLKSMKTTDNGRWQVVVRPGAQTTYRARSAPRLSPTQLMRVRPLLTLDRRHGRSYVARVDAGSSYAGRVVTLQRQQSGRWVYARSLKLGRKSASGFTYKAPARGTSLRIVVGFYPASSRPPAGQWSPA